VRHELDRHSEAFRRIYSQRAACERINSQAVALGIERPHLRNGRSLANLNTLIYVLINTCVPSVASGNASCNDRRRTH
jgi:hypothetical protein